MAPRQALTGRAPGAERGMVTLHGIPALHCGTASLRLPAAPSQVWPQLPHAEAQRLACGEAQPHLRAHAAPFEGATASATATAPHKRGAAGCPSRPFHKSGACPRRLRAGMSEEQACMQQGTG